MEDLTKYEAFKALAAALEVMRDHLDSYVLSDGARDIVDHILYEIVKHIEEGTE